MVGSCDSGEASASRQRRSVLIFRSSLLPLSETFIREQMTHLSRWRPVLAGFKMLGGGGLDLRGLDVHLLAVTWIERVMLAIYRHLGIFAPPRVRAINMKAPDLVHVHFATDLVAHWGWLRRLGVPLVVTLHGYDVQTDPDWWRRGKSGRQMRDYPERLRRIAGSRLVSFIAVSDEIKRSAISKYGLPEDKIKRLYIGVDTKKFKPGRFELECRERVILFVGRLVEKKGLPILIRAVSGLKERYPGLVLRIIGDGPQRAACEALVDELDCPAEFMGAQRASIVRQQLSSCYVFCLPSIRGQSGDAEGLGMVILEAAASGVPVLTSAAGGREEAIVDGVTGFSFNEGDFHALADRLAYLFDFPDKASAMGLRARDFACEHFDVQSCTRALEDYFDHVMDMPA